MSPAPTPRTRGGAARGARRPTLRPELAWSRQLGQPYIAGVDEAGRGPLAGPVVAAAVVWDPEARRPAGINDSKKLSERTRSLLAPKIKRAALAWGVGIATAEEIDLLNILEATRLAAVRAVTEAGLRLAQVRGAEARIGGLVTDALEIPALGLPIHAIIRGDSLSASIAAASILAKTTRDAMMDRYHTLFPEYGWDANKGYPTADHYAAIERHGPTTLHRMTFRGVGFFCEQPRYSHLHAILLAELEECRAGRLALDQWRRGLEQLSDLLPPREIDELRRQAAESA